VNFSKSRFVSPTGKDWNCNTLSKSNLHKNRIQISAISVLFNWNAFFTLHFSISYGKLPSVWILVKVWNIITNNYLKYKNQSRISLIDEPTSKILPFLYLFLNSLRFLKSLIRSEVDRYWNLLHTSTFIITASYKALKHLLSYFSNYKTKVVSPFNSVWELTLVCLQSLLTLILMQIEQAIADLSTPHTTACCRV